MVVAQADEAVRPDDDEGGKGGQVMIEKVLLVFVCLLLFGILLTLIEIYGQLKSHRDWIEGILFEIKEKRIGPDDSQC